MEDKQLLELVNPEFDLKFKGETYRVRKATLDKAVQYQQKVKDLQESKEAGSDLKLIAFCIYIMLKDNLPDLTEQEVLNNTPADIDAMECLAMLGFINPRKVEIAKKLEKLAIDKLTTENSSAISPNEQDGLQTKSEN
jgi:hypothetical protein